MKKDKGKVYIVGAGPGDPKLITVKGLEILKKADCVFYDFLSSAELLNYTKKACDKVCVGKKDGLHLKEQDEINRLLFKAAKKYENVVRLKGGDPFIFSRGWEEAAYLKKRKVRVEAIPGVTSAIAGPQDYGIPLTIKNKIQSVGIVTGRKKDRNAPIDAPDCATLVYLMGVGNISNIVKALTLSGRALDTPCAFIERATCKDSKITYATIETIEKAAEEADVKAPAVLVVGEVVDYGRYGSR
ncbi:MAG: uroporphyrinogen-III C-methyltransferase [Candidatus Omnitrophota bacterium]